MQDVNVKGVTTLEMINKLWEHIPTETKNELIENDADIVKGITVLEQALGVEETMLKVVTVEESEAEENVPEAEDENTENEGDSNDD